MTPMRALWRQLMRWLNKRQFRKNISELSPRLLLDVGLEEEAAAQSKRLRERRPFNNYLHSNPE